jgi:hypothetical protein
MRTREIARSRNVCSLTSGPSNIVIAHRGDYRCLFIIVPIHEEREPDRGHTANYVLQRVNKGNVEGTTKLKLYSVHLSLSAHRRGIAIVPTKYSELLQQLAALLFTELHKHFMKY